MIFPTWRKKIAATGKGKIEERILESSFLSHWVDFCNLDALKEIGQDNEVAFYMHHDNMAIAEYLKPLLPDFVKIVSYNDIVSFSSIVNESRMLVTDYSSFSFDFLYLNKPVVYYDFDENARKSNVRGSEYDRFGYYCTNTEEASEALEAVLARDFVIDPRFSENIAALYPYRNVDHCKLIIEATVVPD